MGLPHGCSKTADALFAKRHNSGQVYLSSNSIMSAIMELEKGSTRLDLTYMRGDCTACTAYMEGIPANQIERIFTAMQEYMSINARISCTFTLKKSLRDIPAYLKELKKFPIAGLHLQKSNREPESDCYMITGILKVPNPIINTYDMYDKAYPDNHNNNDLSAINKINAEFGLQTF